MAQGEHDAMLELQALVLEAPGELHVGLPKAVEVHLRDDEPVEVGHRLPDALPGVVQQALQPADPRPVVVVAGHPDQLGGYLVLYCDMGTTTYRAIVYFR